MAEIVAGAGIAKGTSDCKLGIGPGLCFRAAGAESEEAAALVAAVGELSAPVAGSVVQSALDDECGWIPFPIHAQTGQGWCYLVRWLGCSIYPAPTRRQGWTN